MHSLDELFNPMTVSANGELLPKKQIIEFDETFSIEELEDRVRIRGTGGGEGGITTLGGNVTGDPAHNTVKVITGNGEGDVLVEATSFTWDLDTSEGGAQLIVSGGELDAGALVLKHNHQEVLAAVSNAPRFGNANSIARLLGGMRFSRRLVASNVTLDTTTTDLLVHVNASGERQITLPPPSDGRTILFMIAGPSVVTIRRNGSEQINGIAGNYVVPFQNATVIVTSDGPNWFARSFGDIPPITLGGDAVGSPDANTVRRISGNLSAQVAMGASSLLWDTAVSSGAAEVKISSSDAGAIALRHNASDVLVAAATGARLGTSTGTNRLLGGARLARRTVTTPSVVLDSGSSDAIVHVDASAARLITLPAVSDGRTVVFQILGASTVTIARSAFESINGVAADFVVPFPNALVVATCDGTNWLARAFGDPVTLSTTAPLTGGGALNANRTIGIDPAGFVAPTRAVNTTAPLTGGGALTGDLTLGINTSAFVGVARLINTTAPLTGGGSLIGDLTLAIAGATGAAMGVIQLAGNIAGTAANPLVTGLRADSLSIQNADATHKAVWTAAGLRIGDNAAPGEKLDVAGNGRFGSGACKVTAGGVAGSEATQSAIWLGTAAPSTLNYALFGDTTFGRVRLNAPTILTFSIGGGDYGKWNSTGLRVANDVNTPTKRFEVGGASSFEGDATIGKTDKTSSHSLNGGVSLTTRTVGANLVVDTTTKDLSIFVDATAAVRTITLPAATTAGRIVWIKRVAGTNKVVVMESGSGLDFIEDSSVGSVELRTDPAASGIHPYIAVQADGTNWRIIRHFSATLIST